MRSELLRSPKELAQALTARIESGQWREGSRLPSERELAVEFNLGRNTVRRAMQLMESEGRVERHVGRGTFVTGTGANEPSTLWARFSEYSPSDLLAVRLIIEPQASALAASAASQSELDRIQDLLQATVSARGAAEFEAWDEKLHHAIYAATRNDALRGFSDALNTARGLPGWHRLKHRQASDARRNTYHQQHTELVAALSERDPERAKRASFEHVMTVKHHLLTEQP